MQWVSVGLSYFHSQPHPAIITRVSETDVSLENENMIAVKIADKFLWLPHWNLSAILQQSYFHFLN